MSTRFEEGYPIQTRQKEIKHILSFVTRGQSCQLISVPGAGRSTVLRLLAYNPKLREYHLASLNHEAGSRNQGKQNRQNHNSLFIIPNSYLFIYFNFAELPSFEAQELNKFLFLSILSSIRELDSHLEGVKAHLRGERMDSSEVNLVNLGKEIYAIFKEALTVNDPQVLFRSLKRAIETIQQFNNVTIVFLFDRFSEFAHQLPTSFFSQLRTLRQVSGGKLAVVFSTHRPLEELLANNDFYEYYGGNHVFLEMYDKVATDFRISVLEKEYNKKLDPNIKKELIKITGGHGKLVKLGTQILLSNGTHPRGGVAPAAHPAGVIDFLLDHALIKSSLLEVWQSLSPQERTNSLFPLYDEFVKRGFPETLVPKTIRFDEKTSEIYFGDEELSGLTAQEFKLLKFLIGNPGRVCERDEVINAVWTENKTQAGVTDEALDQMVHRLRKKIEDESDNPKHLLTVKGRGFRFIP